MQVRAGDVVILATDGLWDNLPEDVLLNHIKPLAEGKSDAQQVRTFLFGRNPWLVCLYNHE